MRSSVCQPQVMNKLWISYKSPETGWILVWSWGGLGDSYRYICIYIYSWWAKYCTTLCWGSSFMFVATPWPPCSMLPGCRPRGFQLKSCHTSSTLNAGGVWGAQRKNGNVKLVQYFAHQPLRKNVCHWELHQVYCKEAVARSEWEACCP